MGGPSAAIVVEELADLGARRIVRVGTCGALAGGLALGDLVVAREASRGDGTSRALGAGDRVTADAGLTAALERAAEGRARSGSVLTTDLFYARGNGGPADADGALAVEMEAATILRLAELLGLRAACVLAVTDLRAGSHERIADQRLEELGRRVGRVGAQALVQDRRAGRTPSGLLADPEALLLARDRLGFGRQGLAQRRQLRSDGLQPLLDRAQALVEPGRRGRLGETLVEPVHAVLDSLQALGHRPQPAGEALEVGRRGKVEGAHGDLLGLRGLLTSIESAARSRR